MSTKLLTLTFTRRFFGPAGENGAILITLAVTKRVFSPARNFNDCETAKECSFQSDRATALYLSSVG